MALMTSSMRSVIVLVTAPVLTVGCNDGNPRSPEGDGEVVGVRIDLQDGRSAELVARSGGSVVVEPDEVLIQALARRDTTLLVEVGSTRKRLLVVVEGHMDAETVGIEHGDSTLRVLQVDGVDVLDPDGLRHVWRRQPTGSEETLEILIELDRCVPLELVAVRRYVEGVAREWRRALEELRDSLVLADMSEFGVEIRSVVVERELPDCCSTRNSGR